MRQVEIAVANWRLDLGLHLAILNDVICELFIFQTLEVSLFCKGKSAAVLGLQIFDCSLGGGICLFCIKEPS